MIKYFLVCTLLFLSLSVCGQPAISVEVSADTIGVGESVEIKYTIENGDGKFKMPVLDSLPVISGPNSSSSFMYQNGKQSSNQSYAFVLIGMEEGILKVPAASYVADNDALVIDALEIVVGTRKNELAAPSKKSTIETSKSKREKRAF